ncbi:TRAP transporter large permease [Pseudovibrio ascidiaceicola]|uniref:TRAP transporter large permease n=1 Tax=Pseudovibrio ascidiaceicola TaxID=285279 RepID=UPI000D6879C5|nr:TRAP transporter large permease subunit [Pseudovibrio ascidiaceicola]
MIEFLDIFMFAGLCFAILLGYPVAFTIAGVAVLFAVLGALAGTFDTGLLGALSQRIFGTMTNNVLIAIPLFVFMGLVLERSRIAEDLLEEMGKLFGSLRGGLGISVVLVGGLLAASTGIVGATVVTMALIALPTMLRNGYDPKLAAGTVCTAGTLGQIIPPSTLLIILSEVMSNAYQQAQFAEGKFTVETISVGQTFAAALVPGLMLVGVYIVYLLVRAYLQPSCAPAMDKQALGTTSVRRIASVLIPPVALIIAVLGSILGGVATPTEAAAVGAVGALLLAGFRLSNGKSNLLLGASVVALLAVITLAGFTTIRLQKSELTTADWGLAFVAIVLLTIGISGLLQSVMRMWRSQLLAPVMTNTLSISAMIFATIIGASVFSLIFRGLGGDTRIEELISAMLGGEMGALLFVMALIFALGFFMDFVEISVILLPIVGPTLLMMGFDPIWLSVMIAINLQTSFLTPPFGFSLFYLRGAAPPEITTGMIYKGVLPYILLQIVGMGLVWFFPQIATWLPSVLF